MIDTSRLLPTLQLTGLAHKNQPLYQLLNQLIGIETKVATIINTTGGIGPVGPAGADGIQGIPGSLLTLEEDIINYPIITPVFWQSTPNGIYFIGNVGILQAIPTAYLHLGAGTTGASTAPIKLTSGALLTIAEAGAIEFLTDAYYGTITTGAARKTFAFREDVAVTQGSGKSDAQTGAVASVTAFTVGASNALFLVGANINVTTSTLHNFTCTVSYTDETSTARVLTLSFSQLTGAFVTAITNATGAGAYEGIPLTIRAKNGTTITIATTGTFTTVTYNVAGFINQVALT